MQIKAALKGLSHRHETSKRRRKQSTVPVRIWEDLYTWTREGQQDKMEPPQLSVWWRGPRITNTCIHCFSQETWELVLKRWSKRINVAKGDWKMSTKKKRQPSSTLDGNVSRCSHYRKQYGISLQKKKNQTKNRIAVWSSSLIPAHVSGEKEKTLIQKDTFTSVFIVALFIIPTT